MIVTMKTKNKSVSLPLVLLDLLASVSGYYWCTISLRNPALTQTTNQPVLNQEEICIPNFLHTRMCQWPFKSCSTMYPTICVNQLHCHLLGILTHGIIKTKPGAQDSEASPVPPKKIFVTSRITGVSPDEPSRELIWKFHLHKLTIPLVPIDLKRHPELMVRLTRIGPETACRALGESNSCTASEQHTKPTTHQVLHSRASLLLQLRIQSCLQAFPGQVQVLKSVTLP
ncbi:hypothetical protein DV515_00012172 [Chloebia gouldiae]|uniref:Uncharacterized protein n=1 Tax=Chloebia gouldiae TaxID=44316 RepID=A0A3L8S488_CHLGU|nr:hypothetical protein DV515_00012172 [Chloebia gouldiae]